MSGSNRLIQGRGVGFGKHAANFLFVGTTSLSDLLLMFYLPLFQTGVGAGCGFGVGWGFGGECPQRIINLLTC